MSLNAHRARLSGLYLADETGAAAALAERARFTPDEARRIEETARQLVTQIRAARRDGGIDAFLQQYALDSDEGVALMCLAEALLRVPDGSTADKLIKDKIAEADWERHRGKSDSSFVNASTWALMLTGRVLRLEDQQSARWTSALRKAVTRSGEPVIRQAMTYAMRIMGGQFVLGRTIKEALAKSREGDGAKARYSFDMLGEAAMTRADAARYLAAYEAALEDVAASADLQQSLEARPSLSVKLSALHPRYEITRKAQVLSELVPDVLKLATRAKALGVALTIDAEEADRLELSLELFEALARAPGLHSWNGLGLAVQAYQKRAPAVLECVIDLARSTRRRIPVRLVKGAYWDSEIKRAQELGHNGYPVFTRKQATDVSYLACMRQMLAAPDALYPQFATHNAHTVAAALVLGEGKEFEFQRLHGMGAALYAHVLNAPSPRPVRVYAPVGSHEDLLAYLVRRLLENGANTSFVNRLADDEAPIADIIRDPVADYEALDVKPHPLIPLPPALFGARVNASGPLIADERTRSALMADVNAALSQPLTARPIINGRERGGPASELRNPARRSQAIGLYAPSATGEIAEAAAAAEAAHAAWDQRGGPARAAILERCAALYERDRALLIGLCIREAGKTLPNAIADVREAIDFLRYYAQEARRLFAEPEVMPGPTGERNTLRLAGRGVFASIAPWNFPAAIFTGQIAAALAAGNSVVAKPAEQTPLIAAAMVRLMHEAGVPHDVLHLVLGAGDTGAVLVAAPHLSGVVFTGSTEVARLINRSLAAKDGPIATLIAETGGLNAMIADSTALPEQLVRDALASAFDSAGQRCSALRVLFVQADIAPRVEAMLAGAMEDLIVGDPERADTDIGPVIDAGALAMLNAHAAAMDRDARRLALAPSPVQADGYFFAPRAYVIDGLSRLEREVFGPILHIVRYNGDRLGAVCDAINATGYGLTLGVHTRIAATADEVAARVRAGNIYVNRNQIGAVVGVQPFGGEGLSGTGPKAGGPHYLPRFAVERTLTVNTTAAGGNASLLSLPGRG